MGGRQAGWLAAKLYTVPLPVPCVQTVNDQRGCVIPIIISNDLGFSNSHFEVPPPPKGGRLQMKTLSCIRARAHTHNRIFSLEDPGFDLTLASVALTAIEFKIQSIRYVSGKPYTGDS